MPYKRKGKVIYHKKDGWKVKQRAKSVKRAKRAVRLLHGVESGWRPTGKRAIS